MLPRIENTLKGLETLLASFQEDLREGRLTPEGYIAVRNALAMAAEGLRQADFAYWEGLPGNRYRQWGASPRGGQGSQ
jgi:hypothetical protein